MCIYGWIVNDVVVVDFIVWYDNFFVIRCIYCWSKDINFFYYICCIVSFDKVVWVEWFKD